VIGLLRRVVLGAVGRAGALAPAGRQAHAPRSELERRIEQARRRLKATIPPPEN